MPYQALTLGTLYFNKIKLNFEGIKRDRTGAMQKDLNLTSDTAMYPPAGLDVALVASENI